MNPSGARHRVWQLVVAALAVLLVGGGCANSAPTAPQGTLPVLASFYPLAFVAEQVGGPFVNVTNLTKTGVDPHDLELSPQEVATVADATSHGLLIYLNGFQPALDAAVSSDGGSPARVLDVTPAARLTLTASASSEMSSGADPHFWLDPTRLASVAGLVADRFAQLDPGHAAAFQSRAGLLQTRLGTLDREFTRGLATCSSRDLVTSHTAFAYLAARYHLTQQGIVGLNPEAEPSPAQLADVVTFVEQHHVSTIFYEPLVSPAIADTVARETGTATAILDPLEGLTATDPAATYFSVMKQNLAALRKGLGCT